jgi:sulfate adenylyltransferase
MSAIPDSGVTVFLTGLSGAGKSTIADALVAQLEAEGRPVTVLDGDVVRTHLSSELTFSRADRDLNIRRIGWVAGEVVKHGGTVVVAAIAPYEAARQEARQLVEKHGRFVLVHLSTPLAVCEQRDVKGLYAKARSGEIPEFTGVSDPYEPPTRAEVVLDTSAVPLEESVSRIRAAMGA